MLQQDILAIEMHVGKKKGCEITEGNVMQREDLTDGCFSRCVSYAICNRVAEVLPSRFRHHKESTLC